MINVNCNSSQSIWTLKVNPLTGKVLVRWFSSPLTEYTMKASRRAILALLVSGDRSLGQWVNHNCLQRHDRVKLDWRPVLERIAREETVAALSTAR
jgi:hypothetical protein